MSTKMICLIFLLSCTLHSELTEVKGRIKSCNSGEVNGRLVISVKLDNDKNYFYRTNKLDDIDELDTTSVIFLNFTTLADTLRKAQSDEAIVSIFHGERNIFDSIKTHYENRTIIYNEPKFIKSWEKPTHSGEGYNVGDSVIKGGRFTSLIDNNMWSPQEAPNYWKSTSTTFNYEIWQKPIGAHNCYNKGFNVLYKENVYKSLIDGNVWSPEEYPIGWEYVHIGPSETFDSSKIIDRSMTQTSTSSTPETYIQPTGAHDAYKRGDLVSLDGITYRSIIDANVWSPAVSRAYWEVISGTPQITKWRKPKGIHDCYHKGYKTLFKGKTYESLMNSNVWSPEELRSSWKEVE